MKNSLVLHLLDSSNNYLVLKSLTMILFLRRILLTIVTFLTILAAGNAQAIKNYEKEWKKVEDLINKKQPKSALAEVKKIYTIAKKEKQEAQVIKSLIYISGLQEETREDNAVLAIKEMEKEVQGASETVAAILNSIIASQYYNYFQNNRWQLYDRTKTTQFKKDDIKTWDADDFHKKISELYLRSIQSEQLLKQTRLAPFDAIIIKGNVRHLRPTLLICLQNGLWSISKAMRAAFRNQLTNSRSTRQRHLTLLLIS
jgi:hypothetical protein